MTQRAVLYARVSTSMQERDGVSLDAQLDLARKFCQARGLTLVKNYVDTMSGQSDARPGLAALEADVARGGVFEVLLVYRLDRLWRNSAAYHALLSRLEVAQVGLASLTEPFDATSPIGKLMLTVLVGIAELEVGVTSARVVDSIRYRAEQGRIISNGQAPLGYTYHRAHTDAAGQRHPGRVSIHEEDAAIVRWIFGAYLAGGSVDAVLAQARFLGLRNRGKVFHKSTILRVLRRRDYMGEREALARQSVRRGGKIVSLARPQAERVRTATFPAIVDAATWQAVQAQLDDHGSTPPQRVASRGRHPWSGLLRCATCGSMLTRVVRGRGAKRAHLPGGLHDYRCRQRYNVADDPCAAPVSVPEAFLMRVVAPRLFEALSPLAIGGRRARVAPKVKPLESVAITLADIARRRERVQDMYEAGDLARDAYRGRIERLDAEAERARARLAPAAGPPAMLPEVLAGLQDAWDRHVGDPRARHTMLASLVDGGELADGVLTLRLLPYATAGWPETITVAIPDLRTKAGRALLDR